jgi:catechol 2,3-dioxygenase-like lactoylglutathione lyase family enzyme
MCIGAIDHLNVVADDVEATLDFYRSLGVEVAQEEGIEGRTGRSVLLLNDHQKINVLPRRPGSAAQPAGNHFGLVWDGTVQELVALLDRLGITPDSGPVTTTCARGLATSFYLRDPGGTRVELAVYE